MSHPNAPLTAAAETTPVLRTLGRLARGYSCVFTESRFAERLSPVDPVRRGGFDTRLDVVDVQTVATDVVALTLCRPDFTPLPAWTPGAHIDVFTPEGRQRHYSLTGDRHDLRHYRIAVRRVPDGAGSAEMHRLRVGDSLHVRGPRNAFNLAPADNYVFVAGGIGITPILPMVREVAARTRCWALIYTGRTRDSMPFIDELTALGSRQVDIRPDAECGTPDLAAMLGNSSAGAAFYVCGPPDMIDGARTAASGGRDSVEFHSERFTAARVVDGREFSIVLARSGQTIEVGSDETALQAIRRVKPDVRYSCQQGICGACRVPVLSGAVEHRDRVLTPAQETDSMMICVSRAAAGSIVIDL